MLLALMTLVSLSACQNKTETQTAFVDKIEWEETPRYQFKPSKKAVTTQIFKAPKLSGHRKTISGFEDPKKLSDVIDIKLERAWREGKVRKVIVVLENKSQKGTRANFYLFSHDERGLLIEVKQEEIFFNPLESVFRSFEFLDSDLAKSWSMSVK
jgi:hypothetical protein